MAKFTVYSDGPTHTVEAAKIHVGSDVVTLRDAQQEIIAVFPIAALKSIVRDDTTDTAGPMIA